MAKKQENQSVLFFSQSREDSILMRHLRNHCIEYYKTEYKPIYKRIVGFFHIEAIFALQNIIPKEIQLEISNLAFRKFLQKRHTEYKPKFYTMFFFNWLAKIYFLKCYFLLKKLQPATLIIFDNTTTLKKACIFAAQSLDINVRILYPSHRNSYLFVDTHSTRFESSIPRNPSFFEELPVPIQNKRTKTATKQTNTIVVLLQKDASPEMLLYSPIVKNQVEFLQMLMRISGNVSNLNFVVFGAEKNYQDTQNVFFSNGNFKEILPQSQAVLTCNSVEAIHALKHHKPIIALANASYNIPNISFSAKNEAQLTNILQGIHSLPFNTEIADAFTFFIETQISVKCGNILFPSEEDLDDILSVL